MIKDGEKLPNKVNILLEKTKKIDEEWNNNNINNNSSNYLINKYLTKS